MLRWRHFLSFCGCICRSFRGHKASFSSVLCRKNFLSFWRHVCRSFGRLRTDFFHLLWEAHLLISPPVCLPKLRASLEVESFACFFGGFSSGLRPGPSAVNQSKSVARWLFNRLAKYSSLVALWMCWTRPAIATSLSLEKVNCTFVYDSTISYQQWLKLDMPTAPSQNSLLCSLSSAGRNLELPESVAQGSVDDLRTSFQNPRLSCHSTTS